MKPRKISDLFLNFGHAADHLVMMIYPVVLLALKEDMGLSPEDFDIAIMFSVGSFVAFGACSLPAGWLGDRWSRHGMMIIFFFGIGFATILTGFAQNLWQIAIGLTFIGIFAAIYHPIGIAMVVSDRKDIGKALGVNGVAGNMGIALAAIISGALAEFIHWRAAFIVPGAIIVLAGIAFIRFAPKIESVSKRQAAPKVELSRGLLPRFFIVLILATICGGLIFNATTISLPEVFGQRLTNLTKSTFGIGALVSIVYVLASLAQLLVGYWIDRYPLKTIFIGVVSLQAPLLFLAGLSENYAMLFVAVGMMFVIFGQIPINDAMVAHYTHEKWRSRVFAIRYVVVFGASAAAVPLIAFLYKTTGGFNQTYTILSLIALGTLAAALAMPTDKSKAASPSASPSAS